MSSIIVTFHRYFVENNGNGREGGRMGGRAGGREGGRAGGHTRRGRRAELHNLHAHKDDEVDAWLGRGAGTPV